MKPFCKFFPCEWPMKGGSLKLCACVSIKFSKPILKTVSCLNGVQKNALLIANLYFPKWFLRSKFTNDLVEREVIMGSFCLSCQVK